MGDLNLLILYINSGFPKNISLCIMCFLPDTKGEECSDTATYHGVGGRLLDRQLSVAVAVQMC